MTLGEKIRDLRHARGKTLRELSAEVGVSYQFLHMLEHDVKHRTDRLQAIATALGVDISYFEEER